MSVLDLSLYRRTVPLAQSTYFQNDLNTVKRGPMRPGQGYLSCCECPQNPFGSRVTALANVDMAR